MKAVAGQLDGLMQRLSQLQSGADQNRLRATDARHTATEAGEQARTAQQVPCSSRVGTDALLSPRCHQTAKPAVSWQVVR